MARLTPENLVTAQAIIARYPRPRSALIPLCHLAQEQDGYLTEEAMAHIAELLDTTPAEVYGTASFYEMFKLHRVGKYLIGVCTNISCMLNGAYELVEHAERKLGVKLGGTTPDGLITLEEMECLAACTLAPCLQVNYRYEGNVSTADFDALVDSLRAGTKQDVPPHGTLATVRQQRSDQWADSARQETHS
ncbi:MAG TPA: NAD(P)H-dependent oxidoreductase subunit E [Acidimicrobiales bacterium]|nr:NAD(P)H-dependent oxidoreductase subunit E [Acidimicrobiales bacterium]